MRLALLITCCLLSLTAFAADFPNLVTNPGFEAPAVSGLPESWDGPSSVYSHVTAPVRSGSGALQFLNPDPDNYALCSQQLPLKPGRMYEFNGWVKCEDVVGTDSGATICMEWYNQDGEYLGGSYPAGIKGTQDWTRITALADRIPANAARCSVTCYVRKGMTGKAWWDDVEVRQHVEPPLHTMLVKPNYRGIITPRQNTIRLAAQLELTDYDLAPEDVELACWLTRRDAEPPPDAIPPGATVVRPRSANPELTLTPRHFPIGDYHLNVRLLARADGRILARDQWRIHIRPEGDLQKRTSYIDRHNRLIINGKPFLPLGMYWGGISEDGLKQYADSAFNCLMPYGMPSREQMDLAQRHGLKVIYSVKDIYAGSSYVPQDIETEQDERRFMEAKAAEFKDHPSLLAWYLNDELSIEYMPRLEAHQEWMEELDPNHPTWIVLYQVGQLELYRKTFDVLGTDPYPIPSLPARRAADYTTRSRESVMGARPIWMVPQVMNWACYRETEEEKRGLRPPTYEELRSMTWQCLTEGATGLIYYSWFDLKREADVFPQRWEEAKQVAAEVKRWEQVLLSIEPAPQIKAPQRKWLHWTTRRVGSDVYLFAVNDEDRPHRVTFTLPGVPKAITLDSTGEEVVAAEELPVQLRGFEMRVYRLRF